MHARNLPYSLTYQHTPTKVRLQKYLPSSFVQHLTLHKAINIFKLLFTTGQTVWYSGNMKPANENTLVILVEILKQHTKEESEEITKIL